MIKTSGQGLPHYMYEKNVTIENDHRDDPSELVDRLRLLVSKREAGNTNYYSNTINYYSYYSYNLRIGMIFMFLFR